MKAENSKEPSLWPMPIPFEMIWMPHWMSSMGPFDSWALCPRLKNDDAFSKSALAPSIAPKKLDLRAGHFGNSRYSSRCCIESTSAEIDPLGHVRDNYILLDLKKENEHVSTG
jgi:hypothetical protein